MAEALEVTLHNRQQAWAAIKALLMARHRMVLKELANG